MSYDDLCKKLAEHFNPKPSEIMQRLAFHSRVRAHGESVVEFVATLRRLAADCKFGDSLDENLRDRLVCGINDSAIQRQRLNESNLDLKKALQIATATEATGKHLSQLQATTAKAADATQRTYVIRADSSGRSGADTGTTRASKRHVSSGEAGQARTRTCYRCGEDDHIASSQTCRARDTTCSSCGKRGHFARVCRSRVQRPIRGKPTRREPVHHVDEDGESLNENEEMRLQRITVRHTSARESNSAKARKPHNDQRRDQRMRDTDGTRHRRRRDNCI